MNDLISKSEALNAFDTNLDKLIVGGSENAKSVEQYLNGVIDKIKQLPIKESGWIPCSERLPDKEGDYLVTDDAGGVKTIDVDTLLHYDDSGEPFWCYSQNPVAWRELPVPFGEE